MILRTLMIVAAAASLAACQPKSATSAQGEGPTAPAGDQSAASKAFLAKNAKEPGVVVLPDGLQYKIVTSGPGHRPEAARQRRGEGQLRGQADRRHGLRQLI